MENSPERRMHILNIALMAPYKCSLSIHVHSSSKKIHVISNYYPLKKCLENLFCSQHNPIRTYRGPVTCSARNVQCRRSVRAVDLQTAPKVLPLPPSLSNNNNNNNEDDVMAVNNGSCRANHADFHFFCLLGKVSKNAGLILACNCSHF